MMSLNESVLAEIDFANVLTQLSTSHGEILSHAKADGNINQKPVFLYTEGNSQLYFFTDKHDLEAMILLSGDKLKAIKNFTGQRGFVFALLNYIVVKKGIKLTIDSSDPLTAEGLSWITNLISRPSRLTVTDLNGNKVDPVKLKKEWINARDRDDIGPGATGLIIGESHVGWSKRLIENDNSLMPYAFFDFAK